jgi:hypothetical protein
MILRAREKGFLRRAVFGRGGRSAFRQETRSSVSIAQRLGLGGVDPAGVPLHGCPQGGFARVHGRQGGEDIAQVVSRVDLLFAAGLDEAVEDGAVLPGVARSEKQPVFFFMRSSA